MTRTRFAILIAAIAALAAFAPAASALAPAGTASIGDGPAKQGDLDTQTSDHGGWDHTGTIGIANRPYIRYLSVVNPTGGEMVVIDNQSDTPTQTPTALSPTGPTSNVYAFVATQNACRDGQAPADGQCYEKPNRVAIYIAAKNGDGAGDWTDAMRDLSTLDPDTITPNITEDSEIRLIIGFHDAYSSLGWSWVNGEPTYWKSTVADGDGGTVELRFKPRTTPQVDGSDPTAQRCTTIPVSTCAVNRAQDEGLMPQIILSMDTTLTRDHPQLQGTVFGTEDAIIGSLEINQVDGANALTYGIAGPHLMADGTARKGTFYALLQSSLLSLFGTSVSAFDETLLALARTGDAGTYATDWTEWSASANGTAGQLLKISDISFSAPKFKVRVVQVRKGRTIAIAKIATAFGIKASKYSAKVTTKKTCKVTGKTVKGLKAGVCKITFKAKKKATKPQTRRVAIRVS